LTTALDQIEAKDLACERGGRAVFRDLQFSLSRGAALSLEGANGAGKTSALRIVAGLLSPSAGEIVFRGSDKKITDGEERGRLVAWLGHLDGIKNQLTVSENAQFFAALYSSSGDVGQTLERVGLARALSLPAQYLSAGQRRRLALARLVLSNRPLWLLDEPLAALDTSGKALIAELMNEHCGAGGMVLAATHDPLGIDAKRLSIGAPMSGVP
jgi:heme exporter protein A